MVGRACINHPYMWINTDKMVYNDINQETLTRGEIIEKYILYCESVKEKDNREEKKRKLKRNSKDISTATSAVDIKAISSKVLLAPLYNIFAGEAYCEQWRRDIKRMSLRVATPSLILRFAMKNVPQDVLYGRRGDYVDNEDLVIYEKMKKSTGPMNMRIV